MEIKDRTMGFLQVEQAFHLFAGIKYRPTLC